MIICIEMTLGIEIQSFAAGCWWRCWLRRHTDSEVAGVLARLDRISRVEELQVLLLFFTDEREHVMPRSTAD